ncbi:hypothetical protein [Streptosporangium lutulentum]|uniref:Uncharacterized protein n=1 Tax=Streptosporangium lutulentum TaxID=1461250 RepID=A0ABT9QJG3_9ACTN|nr:hypothetical protein [Streptosporangium lutulentum]MDP9846896.1 hypothetical protein [Streptosporangium lutulentum]
MRAIDGPGLPLRPAALETFAVMLQSQAYGEIDDQELNESANQHEEHAHARGIEIHDFSLIAV